MYDRLELEAQYVKEEIEIRVESMKIQLDELKQNLINEVKSRQEELNE